MRRILVTTLFAGAIALGSTFASSAFAQPEPPEVAPPALPTPPAAETPGVVGVPVAQSDTAAEVAAAAVLVAGDQKALVDRLQLTFAELARLVEEIEVFDKKEPVPPNAAELRMRAMASIRDNWNAAARSVERLPQDVRPAFDGSEGAWEREPVLAADLRTVSTRIADRLAQRPAAAVVVVPAQEPLKTKTMQAVLAQLRHPETATFPANWTGEFDEPTDRYVLDDVVDTRDAQGLVKVIPFRAEWAYVEGAWQLAFLRVDGEAIVDRALRSVLPVGERPALVYVDQRVAPASFVATGPRAAVSELKGAYLAYPTFLADSRVWTHQNGQTFRARLLRAAVGQAGVVVELQPFDQENVRLAIATLSRADQAAVVEWMKQNPESIPPTISTPE